MRALHKIAGWSLYALWRAGREKRLPYLPTEQLLELQAARVRRMVRHAWRTVPYYRDAMRSAGLSAEDIVTGADLARLPILTKEELTREPERFMSSAFKNADGLTLHSSGTTGRMRSFRHDARSLFEALAAGRRQRIALAAFTGREAGYREAVLNRDGSAGAQIRAFYETRSFTPRRVDLRRLRLSPALPFEELLTRLNDFRPDVIRGYGSHLGSFLRWVHEHGREFHSPKAVTYGADAMTAADRTLIEQEMSIPVMSTYQAVEALRIGFQCERRKGFHLSLDQVVVRIVDGAGRDVGPGERGDILISNLTNRAMVVLNYRLGDVVRAGRGPCPCGRNLPVIEDIEGRIDDMIRRPDGSSLHALGVIPPLQAEPGVRQVQLVQEGIDDFLLRVAWIPGAPQNVQNLVRKLESSLGPAVRVRVEAVPSLPPERGGKVRVVISNIVGE